MGNTYTGSNSGKAGLEVTEVDGTPDVFGVGKIIVSNGTLTDDGGGTVTITTGGGGGGAVTSVGMGTTGLTPAAAATGVITVAGTLVVANGGTGATTLTDGGVLLGSGTGAITALGQPADGQLIIGSTGADPVLGVLSSAGSSIEFLFGAGVINMEVGATSVVAGIYTNTDLTVGADGRITAAARGGGGGVTLSGTTNNTKTTVTGANALIGEAKL